ncbi:MAG: glycosyltransferase family 9 protein [Rhodothermaceae bacterium]
MPKLMKIAGKKKILVIRLSSLGDVILTTPVVRAIKEQYPEASIDFVVKPEFGDAIKYNQNIDNIFYYSKKEEEIRSLLLSLNENKYDLVIDLQNNKRSKKICKSLRTSVVKYKKSSVKRFMLVKFKINRLKNYLRVSEKYVTGIEDLQLDDKSPEIHFPKEFQEIKLPPGKKYIGICPGTKHITKMWPIEYFIELGKKLNELGYTVLLFGGKDDIDLCKYVSIYVKDSINLANNDELLKLADGMRHCDLLICNDSGMMHTASALNKPLIAIFGSTVKEFGFEPYKCDSLLIENENLKCRPCSHIGKDACPKKHFKCMMELTPELVINKVERFLDRI